MKEVFEMNLIPGKIYRYKRQTVTPVRFTGERTEFEIIFEPVKGKGTGGYSVDLDGKIRLGRWDHDIWMTDINIKFGR